MSDTDLTSHSYVKRQYGGTANLDARAQLHARFSVDRGGWFPWLFNQIALQPSTAVLELGCGTGDLWIDNLDRIPPDVRITMSDLSPGMVVKARDVTMARDLLVASSVIDIQAIPYRDRSFDVVMANHMLYHVPDRRRGLREARRVLRPGGRFCASTVGKEHMRELYELASSFDPSLDLTDRPRPAFTLENGQGELGTVFSDVETYLYEDELRVTEAEPLAAYLFSTQVGRLVGGERRGEFARFASALIEAQEVLRITKAMGLFVASR